MDKHHSTLCVLVEENDLLGLFSESSPPPVAGEFSKNDFYTYIVQGKYKLDDLVEHGVEFPYKFSVRAAIDTGYKNRTIFYFSYDIP